MSSNTYFLPMAVKAPSHWVSTGKSGTMGAVVLRDQFEFKTSMLFGALGQLFWTFLFQRNLLVAFAPVTVYALYKLSALGLRLLSIRNGKLPPNVLRGTMVPIIPTVDGTGRSDMCVIILAARSNHPLGLLAPGFKELGDRFTNLSRNLNDNPEEWGYLGGTSWIGMDSATSNSIMTIHYFRSAEDLHNFARKGAHWQAWKWWEGADYPYVSISHEFFFAKSNDWEAVYANSPPTGLGATSFRDKDGLWRRSAVEVDYKKTSSSKRKLQVRDDVDEVESFSEKHTTDA